MTANLVFQAPREPQTELTQKPDASSSPMPLVSILLDDADVAFLPVQHPFPLSLLILWIIHIPSPNGSSQADALAPTPTQVNEGQPPGHSPEQRRGKFSSGMGGW